MSGILCAIAGATYINQPRPLAISVVGNAQVDTAQSKFGGASLLLDGSGDYLTVDNSAGTLSFGTSADFTFEAWCRFPNTNTDQTILSGPGQTSSFILQRLSSNVIVVGRTNTAYDAYSTASATTANVFQHIAVSRSSGTLKIFVNGTEVHSSANTFAYSCTNLMGIGGENVYGSNTNAHIDEVRVSNTARYTTGFTPSTSAFTNDANTVFLCHMDGTDASTTFTDDNNLRSQKSISTNGNAQVSTAQNKFGGASALFDGTGDYLQIDDFGTVAGSNQNFTIETWIRWSSLTGSQGITSDRSPTSAGYVTPNFYLEKNSSHTFYFGYKDGSDIINTSSVAADTWYHLAVVRNSGTTTLYLNGSATGNTLSYTGVVGDGTLSIGAIVGLYMNGYIDEFRISSTARYTANFTPSASAFTNDGNTLLLIHADGTNASTTFTDDNA